MGRIRALKRNYSQLSYQPCIFKSLLVILIVTRSSLNLVLFVKMFLAMLGSLDCWFYTYPQAQSSKRCKLTNGIFVEGREGFMRDACLIRARISASHVNLWIHLLLKVYVTHKCCQKCALNAIITLPPPLRLF